MDNNDRIFPPSFPILTIYRRPPFYSTSFAIPFFHQLSFPCTLAFFLFRTFAFPCPSACARAPPLRPRARLHQLSASPTENQLLAFENDTLSLSGVVVEKRSARCPGARVREGQTRLCCARCRAHRVSQDNGTAVLLQACLRRVAVSGVEKRKKERRQRAKKGHTGRPTDIQRRVQSILLVRPAELGV